MTVTGPRPATADVAEPPARWRRVPMRTRVVLVAAVAVLLAVVAIWVIAFSSLFGVSDVVVTGGRQVTAAQVRAAAAIADGTPLVRLDTDAVAARVERLPDVAAARVTTAFPSTVTITVEERVVVGVVRAGDGFRLVDRTGVQFRTVARRPDALPLFGLARGAGARATGQAVTVVAAALPPDLRSRVRSIDALDPAAVTLQLRGGRVVHWGGADRSQDKARLLPALLARPAGQIDVSDPDQPFTR